MSFYAKDRVIFTWENILVIMLTFFQGFLIMYLVHWKWNKFDISLDAVVKYFASGFLLSSTLALTFELILHGLLQLMLGLLWYSFPVSSLAYNTGYGDSNDSDSNSDSSDSADDDEGDDGTNYILSPMKQYLHNHPFLAILYFSLSTYVVSALVEEICKYFGYAMLQHPDLLCPSPSQERHLLTPAPPTEFDSDTSHSEDEGPTHLDDDSPTRAYQKPTLVSQGNAITIAMVATALGFSCAENLSYLLLHNDIRERPALLLMRSLPLHPLCAALQSISVCRRRLEGKEETNVGLFLPALILHGTFEFAHRVCDFLRERRVLRGEETGNVVLVSLA